MRYDQVEFEAITFAGVPSIPEELSNDVDMSSVWSRAIAVILNNHGEKSLAIVRNNMTSTPSVIKLFDPYGVSKIISIHPYQFENISFPEGVKSKLELRRFLANAYNVSFEEMDSVDEGKLMKLYANYIVKKKESQNRKKATNTRNSTRKQNKKTTEK